VAISSKNCLAQRGGFVVQLSNESDIAQGIFTGQVEHVHSGRQARFQSQAEVFAFIRRVLLEQEDQDD
jgi:hypothetical protein